MLLNHLCYASGNSEPGVPEGNIDQARQRVDNFAAGFIKAGASAVIAEAQATPNHMLATILRGGKSIEAVGRPDLSHGAYPNLNLQRHWEITVFRVRPGFEPMFADVAKMYKGLVSRAMSKASWRAYEVTAGMLGPTYLIFSSVENFAGFDASMADGMALPGKMTAEEGALWMRFGKEGLISAESNRYSLSAGMSYVTAETRASDPKFWAKK